MEQFLQSNSFDYTSLDNKFAGTYVSTIHQKLLTFTSQIIKAPQSGLSSEHYHMIVKYDNTGNACLIGGFWPNGLSDINTQLAEGNGMLESVEELFSFTERNIFIESRSQKETLTRNN